jgi:hypothetical protein
MIFQAMRRAVRVVGFLALSAVLGLALSWGLLMYVYFVLDERECNVQSWLGRAVCGDSWLTVWAVCAVSAGVVVWATHRLVRRAFSRPVRR